jgi:hypothetical protein
MMIVCAGVSCASADLQRVVGHSCVLQTDSKLRAQLQRLANRANSLTTDPTKEFITYELKLTGTRSQFEDYRGGGCRIQVNSLISSRLIELAEEYGKVAGRN